MPDAKKPFFSITNDIDDEAIERVARAKGVPEMTAAAVPREVAARQMPERSKPERAGEGAPVRTAAARPPAKPTRPETTLRETAEARSRPAISYVKAGIPDYALVELKTRAIERRVSLNHLILTALKATGITIRPEDLIEDGRRLRGRNAPSA